MNDFALMLAVVYYKAAAIVINEKPTIVKL